MVYEKHGGCGRCGGHLVGRAWPAHHWGSWCWQCNAWYPDADGQRADTTQPPTLELIDATEKGTVIRPIEEG